MAISWTDTVRDETTGNRVRVDGGVTHVGLVMGPPTTTEERVMSDVYANVTRVPVWDEERGEPSEVATAYHFECDDRVGSATVDFDRTRPDYLAWVAKRDALAAKAESDRLEREAYEAEARAKAVALPLVKGAEVVVTRARKKGVKGVRGTVGWIGASDYGHRVGIDPLDGGTRVWTASKNVDVVLPGKPVDYIPLGGWTGLAEKALTEAEEKAEALAEYVAQVPGKGSVVTHTASGTVCQIFWKKGWRLGMRRKGSPKSEDPIWARAWEVEMSDGTRLGKPPGWVDRPAKGSKPAPTPAGFTDEGLKGPSAALLALPEPYCNIRELVEVGVGSFNALDAEGGFLVALPKSGAQKIAALLG